MIDAAAIAGFPNGRWRHATCSKIARPNAPRDRFDGSGRPGLALSID